MKLRWNYKQSKRAVSPVVSSILMITLVLAAGVGVTVVLNNLDGTPTIQTTDSAIGSLVNSTDPALNFNLDLVKSYYDLQIFYDEGKKYYTTITVELNYTGNFLAPNSIYVADGDILMYGEKLDDASEWMIEDAVGATAVYDNFGNLVGYEQAKDTSATYTISLIDTTVVNARLNYDTSFTYRLKVGTSPGSVEFLVQNEELSKLAFDVVRYNVSIIHYKQKITKNKEIIYMWKQHLIGNNGSKKIIFNYNDASDLYDVGKGDLNGINVTAFVEKYDIILWGEWGIHTAAAALARAAKAAGVHMLFAGRIKDLYKDGVLDYQATADVIGIDPIPYAQKEKVELNYYTFNDTNSNLLLGVRNNTYQPYNDRKAYDVAKLSANSNATVYGIAHYELYKSWNDALQKKNVRFQADSVALVATDGNETEGRGLIAALTLENKKATQESKLMQNMLLYITNEPERVQLTSGNVTLDNIFQDVDGNNKGIHFTITSMVTGADLNARSLNFTLAMDLSVPFTQLSGYEYRMYVGAAKIDKIPYSIVNNGTNYVVNIAIGNMFPWDIPAGTQIILELAKKGKFMKTQQGTNTYPGSGVPWTFYYEWVDQNNVFGTNSVTL